MCQWQLLFYLHFFNFFQYFEKIKKIDLLSGEIAVQYFVHSWDSEKLCGNNVATVFNVSRYRKQSYLAEVDREQQVTWNKGLLVYSWKMGPLELWNTSKVLK